jgi:REP element-mobilizing transposase RayT
MVRPLRLSFENAFYHITARGNKREKIFYSPRDKEVFLKRLKEMLIKYAMTCHAYCLMDHHYHLFIKTTKPNLSQGIHYLNSAYTNWFRNQHQIIGPLFQGRFKSILVDADNYALMLSAYIHLNPLRAGIVKQLEDYPWSSYLDYLNLRKSPITDPSFVLNLIDHNTLKAIKKYRNYLIENQDMKDPIRESYYRIALGSTTFIEKIKEKIDQEGRRREIPSTRTLSKYDMDTIILKMTQVLHLEKKAIFDKKRGNLYRPLALYLIKRFTPLSLSEIGKLFKMDYSAVSQAAKRFEQKSEVNQEIKEVMQKVVTALKEE